MHVLLIGGTGNLSEETARRALEGGHRVSVLTRGRRPPVPGARPLAADRHDPEGMKAAIGGDWPDVAVNFLGFEPADVELDFNLFGDRIQQYVFISSATVYAKPNRRLPIVESSPLGNPFSPYAQKKQACEEWLLERVRASRFPATIVRPSHTYGPRWVPNPVKSDNYTLVSRMERGLPVFVPDDGQGLWTLTAASDFAAGLVGLLGRTDAVGEAFHITSDESLTWNQIYAEIARAAGIREPQILRIPTWFICRERPETIATLPGDKAESAVFDNAKIKRFVPGFACRTSFREGIAQSIDWFRAHPEQRTPVPAVDEVYESVSRAWMARTAAAPPA